MTYPPRSCLLKTGYLQTSMFILHSIPETVPLSFLFSLQSTGSESQDGKLRCLFCSPQATISLDFISSLFTWKILPDGKKIAILYITIQFGCFCGNFDCTKTMFVGIICFLNLNFCLNMAPPSPRDYGLSECWITLDKSDDIRTRVGVGRCSHQSDFWISILRG